jgi:alkylated DNA repair protein (DNA oxidative demethylase)
MTLTGFRLFAGHLTPDAQHVLVEAAFKGAEEGPFYRPMTPMGRPMSVEMTNFGALGWVTDAAGYRYEPRHPMTGRSWPAMPQALLDLWRVLSGAPADADCCLVNLYRDGARMGLHQDRDEADFSFPVLSVSLGDTAVFRLGGVTRAAPSRTLRLASGDVCLLGGDARLAFHGVDRVIAGSSRLIPGGGRLNLTLRRAEPRDL